MAMDDPLGECIGFDWDESNIVKNWERHRVTPEEAEEVFFYEPLVVRSDVGHSSRKNATGQSGAPRADGCSLSPTRYGAS